ncbi:hypothetical protein [Alteromonas sp. MTD1]
MQIYNAYENGIRKLEVGFGVFEQKRRALGSPFGISVFVFKLDA